MIPEKIDSLRRDFLEWSGGFEPEGQAQITVYVDYACDGKLDPNEVRRALEGWMNEGEVMHAPRTN